MESTKNSTVNTQVSDGGPEDGEINLIDYILILGKHKFLIVLGSLLPAVLVGLGLYLLPREYTVSYAYKINIDHEDFNILQNIFYSQGNTEKIALELREKNVTSYAERNGHPATTDDLRKYVSFEVYPSYVEKMNQLEAKDIEKLEMFRQTKGSLLIMHVKLMSGDDFREITRIFRDSFEQFIPVDLERIDITDKIVRSKTEMVRIKESKFGLNQQLERRRSALDKLKQSTAENQPEVLSDVVLQFDNADQNSPYLPLSYQIQALKTQIVNLEEEIQTDQKKYDYNASLLQLFTAINNYLQNGVTLKEFHSFLMSSVSDCQERQDLRDYLTAYILRVENIITQRMPVVEKPRINSLAKGVVQKSTIVFAIALMMSVFTSFLLEGFKKSRVHAS